MCDDLSASKIGERLGRSRSSVINKAHRLKLNSKEQNKRGKVSFFAKNDTHKKEYWTKERREKVSKTMRSAHKHKKKYKEIVKTAYGEGKNIKDLKHDECRWPIEDGKDMVFCSAKCVSGKSYCKEHYECSVRKTKAPNLDLIKKRKF